eukprot:UN02599
MNEINGLNSRINVLENDVEVKNDKIKQLEAYIETLSSKITSVNEKNNELENSQSVMKNKIDVLDAFFTGMCNNGNRQAAENTYTKQGGDFVRRDLGFDNLNINNMQNRILDQQIEKKENDILSQILKEEREDDSMMMLMCASLVALTIFSFLSLLK